MKQTKITTPAIADTITYVPLADLYLHPLNPRQEADPEGIEALAESIRSIGLIQNLSGLADTEGRVGIVAGGRRLRALQIVGTGQEASFVVPVKLARDEAEAEAWAKAENIAREALHPADEIRAYGAMATKGASVPAIALAFAVSEAHVYRRLKLASLPESVLDALKFGTITLAGAECFTISNDENRSIEALERIKRGDTMSAHSLRQLLQPGAIRMSDRRAIFVGEAAYGAAGGKITRDLFSEDVFLEDADLLNTLFNEKLAQACSEAQAGGWAWAECYDTAHVGWYEIEQRHLARLDPTPGELSEAECEEYDELAELANGDALSEAGQARLDALCDILKGMFSAEQKAVSGVLIHVSPQGELRQHEGLVRPEDKAKAIAAGVLHKPSEDTKADTPKGPISAKLAEDLARITRGARQNAVLDQPDLVLDLLAIQLSGKLGYRRAFGLACEPVANQPTTKTGYALDPRLAAKAGRGRQQTDLAKAFRAQRKDRAAIRGDLIRHLAALLSIDDKAMAALIDKEAKTDIRAVWTPTAENFFGRVPGPHLDTIWCTLLDLKPGHPSAANFARLKKAEKAEKLERLFGNPETRKAYSLTPEQESRIATWLPEGMA
jgi:ParB family transcriptional regulator, chromosome partitioning protein